MKPFAIIFAILSAFVLSANAADTFKIDSVHTFVLFSVQHLGIANTYGRFNDISGTVVFDKRQPFEEFGRIVGAGGKPRHAQFNSRTKPEESGFLRRETVSDDYLQEHKNRRQRGHAQSLR